MGESYTCRMADEISLGQKVYKFVNKMNTMQDVISIRIPKELKERMKSYPINWKDYLIEAIEEKIKQFEAEKVLKEIEKMNEKLEPSKIPSWKLIREDRDEGH